MARKSKQDLAKAKEAKQKKILIIGSVLLVLVGAIQIPRTMKMLNQKPKPPVAAPATTTDPNAAPADPSSLAAPTLAGAPTSTATPATATPSTASLVSAVPVSADPGQLQTFERFATKDPFAQQAPAGGSSSGGSGGSGSPSSGSGSGNGITVTTSTPPPPAPSKPSAPPPAALTSAVISVNGELGSVGVGTDFPTGGTVFSRVGAIFHLVSVTAKAAKIAIAGGSYANGAPTITLTVSKPVTLQNTADGTKYTLILEPQGTQVTAPGAATGASRTPTSTTPVVPSGSGG